MRTELDLEIQRVPGMPKWMTVFDLRDWILKRSTRRGECLIVAGYCAPGLYQKGPGRANTHIASFVAFGRGKYVKGLDIAHSCSSKDCVEPSHLSQKTHQQNCLEDAQRRALRIMCPHPRVRNGQGRLMICRPCQAESQRRWRQRNARVVSDDRSR